MFTDSYMDSALRHICSVLAIAAAVAATDITSAQQSGSAAPDIRTGVYRGRVVTYEVIDGLAVWDGDIILGTPEELDEPAPHSPRPARHFDTRQKALVAVSSKERLWPGGIVPYVIDPELSNPNDVLEAIQNWNENTVIRLVERTDQTNWVRFVPTDNGLCRAHLGMIGGEQKVFLREFCGASTVIHEIGHAVGLWHEHQRNDRDTHVWVSSDPFNPIRFAYEQQGGRALDSGPYDYSSIMHYGGSEYIKTIPPSIGLGSGVLSAGDIDGVNRLYGKIPTETTITTNPAGLMIEVDGETYTAPHSFDWAPGSNHVIGVRAPQKHWRDDYIRHLFAKWSDGGAQSHSVTASSETTVFIANFIRQVRPRYSSNPPRVGTFRFDPPSASGFYVLHSFFKAIAEPAEGFSFERWQGWGPGNGPASNPQLGRVWWGLNRTALFTRQTLTTIDTNVPGSNVTVDGHWANLPRNFAWEAGSTHTLGLLVREDTGHDGVIQPYFGFDGERLLFDGWSDGGADTHDITVSGEPGAITANFTRQVLLDTVSHEHGPGTVAVEPGESEGGYYDLSSSVQLTAQPAPGFEFVSWLEDLSGSENPKSLLMNSRKWVRASFIDLQSFESDRIISGEPVEWLFGPGSDRSRGYNGYWVNVPTGATQLAIHLVTATQGTDVDLYANHHRHGHPHRIYGENNEEIIGYASQYLSTGPGGNKSITITPESSPPLEAELYFIAINVRTAGVRIKGTLTAEVNVSESVISANVPGFGFPASLFTKTVQGETPPPQELEIRNSGEGTLDYRITTDQYWLSVSPDHGSSVGETDTVKIAVDPANLEPGAFEGAITITAPPAWPVKVPVTLIVTRDQGQFTWDQGQFPLLGFAHFANGASITSDLVFVNVATHPIRPALDFYDKEGNPIAAESVVDVTGDLEVQGDGGLTVQTAIEPLGELTISTHGQGELVSGSVKVTANGPIGGVLRFDLPGVGVAGVGASLPIADALFPARRQAGGISTAVAIHSLGAGSIVVRCRLMKGGAVLEEVEIPLEANGQEAQFIEEMFTTTDTSDFVGSVRCTGPDLVRASFTGVAVELDAANRIFTTLPVVPVNRGDRSREAALGFAHFANGASITSDLVFVNVATHPIRPALDFYDKEGNPIAAESVVDVTGDLEVQGDGGLTVQTAIEPLGELTISTHGQGELVSGSVKVTANGPIGGVLRFDLPGVGVAGVGASLPIADALFPARRQAGGISTAVAIHSLGAGSIVVRCRLMKGGAVLEEVEIPLEANGQEAQFIEEMFTTTDTSDFVGSVRCTAPEGGLFTGVAVELDAANRIFTTLPVVPVPERTSRE